MNKITQKYTIDRSKWICGGIKYTDGGESKLLNSEGRMCCLGQICIQAGIKLLDITGKFAPANVLSARENPKLDWLVHEVDPCERHDVYSSDIARSMMHTNDDCFLDETTREAVLVNLAREAGVELTFTGKLGLTEKEKT